MNDRQLKILPNAMVLVLMVIGVVFGNDIQLKNSVQVTGPQVMLSDVAGLKGEQAQMLADMVVGEFAGSKNELTIRLAEIRKLLEDKQVNMATFVLRGFVSCKITRGGEASVEIVEPIVDDSPSLIAANPIAPMQLKSYATLREYLVEYLERLTGVAREQLDIKFTGIENAILDQSMPDAPLIETSSRASIGRMSLVVQCYANGVATQTYRLRADVAQLIEALVVKYGMLRGQTFTESDVELRQVKLTKTISRPLGDVKQVVGQIAVTTLRQGTVILSKHLQSPILVKRGEIVTVRAFVGGVVIKAVAQASDNGALGQIISVRNIKSKERYMVRVTGSQRAMSVASTVAPDKAEQMAEVSQ